MYRIMVTIFSSFLLSFGNIVLAEERHALVIGNSKYQHALPLKNPKYDAIDMARTLQDLFFNVTLIQDATKSQIEKAVTKYVADLKKNGGVGLFFYAGHGVQLEGNNYLVPVETHVGTDEEIKYQSFDIARLLNGVRSVKTKTNIIILDACRNNPFTDITKEGTRSMGIADGRGIVRINVPKLDTGLSKLDAPPNTLIAFATAPGRVASDGHGRNSPYTAELVNAMQNTGLTIVEVFRQVRKAVVKNNKDQIPWESSSLIDDFYFKPRASISVGF